jgi:hypothetical protein
MQPDLDRLLRESRSAVPDPDPAAMRRGIELVLARVGTGRGGRRFGLFSAAIVALLVGSGFGFALGTSQTSSGNAASPSPGVGFLPEQGWDVLQSGRSATLDRPTVSIAANVDIHPYDDADGLPLSTLEALPRSGIVIIASFTGRGQEPSHDNSFSPRSLPLSIRDGAPLGAQLRPERPLGQYELRAAVRDQNVHIEIYFGTPRPSPAFLARAQRQLARLVVAPAPSEPVPKQRAPAELRRAAVGRPLSLTASRVFDRTLACTPNYGNLDVVASPRGASELATPHTSSGYARVTSGPHGEPLSDLVVVARPGFRTPSTRFPAAAYASSRRCAPSRAAVPLTSRGLPGPPTPFVSHGDCTVDGKVLVRVRARVSSAAPWRRLDRAFVGARGRLVEAELAVRDMRTRTPLAFATVGRTGKTKLWTSSGCA